MELPEMGSQKKQKSGWVVAMEGNAVDSTACEQRKSPHSTDADQMLLCDGVGCGKGCHCSCLSVVFAELDEDASWYCVSCAPPAASEEEEEEGEGSGSGEEKP